MTDVPRETPPVPATARGVFSSAALPMVERYARLLATDGVRRGLIGPREVPRLWDRHLINSAALAPALAPAATVADVGSGAGLPGLVLAIARPDLHITLIEPLLRRTIFLEEAVAALELDRVTVVRARAEELHGTLSFDVVTSRAVAPLERLLRWCMPLAGPDGCVLALKGAAAAEEVQRVRPQLARRGWGDPELLVVGPGGARPWDAGLEDREGHEDREVSPGAPASGGATVRAVRVRWADPSRVFWPVGPPSPDPVVGRRPSRRTTEQDRRR